MSSSSSASIFLRPNSNLATALHFCGSKRPTVEAWLNWWHEINRIFYDARDNSVAERKLAWWSKTVTLSFEIPPQHPILKKIAPGAGVLTGPPIDLWLSQLQALSLRIGQAYWTNDADMTAHIDATTGAACQSVVWLMGARETATLQIARNMSQGLHRAQLMFRLGQDARRGQLNLPSDCLQKHGVTADELLHPALTNHPSHVFELLETWQKDAKSKLLLALDQVRTLPREEKKLMKPLVVLSQLYLHLIDDLQKQNYPILHQRISIGPLRKLWISRKTAWTWL